MSIEEARAEREGTELTQDSTFTRGDADRILRRAAQIEGSEDFSRLSATELRSIAGEVGLGAHAIERALAEAQSAVIPEVRRPPVQKWGFIVTHLSAIREIPIQISSDQLMKVVRLFQPYRDGSAQVKLEEHEITWRDRKGLQFAVTSAAGVTEIRVYVSQLVLRRGRWMGWVKSAAGSPGGFVQLVGAPGPRGRYSGTAVASGPSRCNNDAGNT